VHAHRGRDAREACSSIAGDRRRSRGHDDQGTRSGYLPVDEARQTAATVALAARCSVRNRSSVLTLLG
jgi:hypothetical protein